MDKFSSKLEIRSWNSYKKGSNRTKIGKRKMQNSSYMNWKYIKKKIEFPIKRSLDRDC